MSELILQHFINSAFSLDFIYSMGSLDFVALVNLISFQKPLESLVASFVAVACDLIFNPFCLHHLSVKLKVARDFRMETAI